MDKIYNKKVPLNLGLCHVSIWLEANMYAGSTLKDVENMWSLVFCFEESDLEASCRVTYSFALSTEKISEIANNLTYLLAGVISEFYLDKGSPFSGHEVIVFKSGDQINSNGDTAGEYLGSSCCFLFNGGESLLSFEIEIIDSVIQKMVQALRDVLPEMKIIEHEASGLLS